MTRSETFKIEQQGHCYNEVVYYIIITILICYSSILSFWVSSFPRYQQERNATTFRGNELSKNIMTQYLYVCQTLWRNNPQNAIAQQSPYLEPFFLNYDTPSLTLSIVVTKKNVIRCITFSGVKVPFFWWFWDKTFFYYATKPTTLSRVNDLFS